MSAAQVSPEMIKRLMFVVILEAICIIAGVAMFLVTDNLIWIAIGVLGGLGISLPVMLKLVFKTREKSGA